MNKLATEQAGDNIMSMKYDARIANVLSKIPKVEEVLYNLESADSKDAKIKILKKYNEPLVRELKIVERELETVIQTKWKLKLQLDKLSKK